MREIKQGDALCIPSNYNAETVFAAAVIATVYTDRYAKKISIRFADTCPEPCDTEISVGFEKELVHLSSVKGYTTDHYMIFGSVWHKYRKYILPYEPAWEVFDIFIMPLIESVESSVVEEPSLDAIISAVPCVYYPTYDYDSSKRVYRYFKDKLEIAQLVLKQIITILSKTVQSRYIDYGNYLVDNKSIFEIRLGGFGVISNDSLISINSKITHDQKIIITWKLHDRVYMIGIFSINRREIENLRLCSRFHELPASICGLPGYLGTSSNSLFAYFDRPLTEASLYTLLYGERSDVTIKE